MTDNPYERQKYIERYNLADYISNEKEYTSYEFADVILKYVPIGGKIFLEQDWDDDFVYFMVKIEVPETDAQYNRRIKEYERKKNVSIDKAAKKEAKERAMLRKLKEKYPDE